MNVRFEIDPEELQPVVEAAVERALRRILDKRLPDGADKVLLSKQQAADVLGVSVSTVDRLRQKHGLPCVKLDGLVLFRPEALRAWAAAKEAAGEDGSISEA